MSKSPAFQFYPDDFMGGKPGMMNPEQTHVYIWLLCLDWNQNGFFFDERTLARWCRVTPGIFRSAWKIVQENFSSSEGRWYNERLSKERIKQAAWREKSAKGGRSKKQPPLDHPLEDDATNDEPNGNIPLPSPFPTPVTALTTSRATHSKDTEDFEACWSIYPKRSGGNPRQVALKAYLARRRTGVPHEELLSGARRYAAYCDASEKTGTEFVMQGGRFFGPSEPFREAWEIQATNGMNRNGHRMHIADRVAETIAKMTAGGIVS